MNITGSEKFEKFCKKYNDAQPALEKWVAKKYINNFLTFNIIFDRFKSILYS